MSRERCGRPFRMRAMWCSAVSCDYATHTNERTAASYLPPNFVPVAEAGLFDLVEGEREIVPGISVLPTPGHVPFHQGILLESKGERAFFLGDLVPTAAHLPLPWIMGYDVEPLVTLETKRRMLARALEGGVAPHLRARRDARVGAAAARREDVLAGAVRRYGERVLTFRSIPPNLFCDNQVSRARRSLSPSGPRAYAPGVLQESQCSMGARLRVLFARRGLRRGGRDFFCPCRRYRPFRIAPSASA